MNRFQYPYFHAKAPDFLSAIFHAQGQLHRYRKGRIIALYGDKPKNMHFVKTGLCMLEECSRKGQCKAVGILLPGGTYGEPLFMDDYNRADFQALSDMEILSISGDLLIRELQKQPDQIKKMLGYVMEKVNYFEHIRYNMIEYNVVQRFAMLLKSYVKYMNLKPSPENCYTFDLKLSQEMLARILHTSRSSISLLLTLLEKEGFIMPGSRKRTFRSDILEDSTIFELFEEIHWTDLRNKNRGCDD